MNVFTFGLLLATGLWSIIYDQRLIKIFFIVVGIYILLELYYRTKSHMSSRKKISIATWSDTGDPTVRGRVEIDLTNVDNFITRFNKENPNTKLTYTHIALKSLGLAADDNYSNFGKICFGSFLPAKSMDVSVFVNLDDKRTANVLVRDCKNSSILDIVKQLKQKISYLKNQKSDDLDLKFKILNYIPTFIIQIIFTTFSFISYNLGISLPLLGMKVDQFGYAVVVNVGKLGISGLFIPLTSFTKSILVGVVNAVYDKPVVVDGKIEIRKHLDLCVTFDHRFADGSDANKMLKRMTDVWVNPDKYL